ncbi:SusC/RagA family TonB-linked outer membrane protein [Sphingobacterium luzhongxinii]|uniref:SusC/RagA family TonB-linked outer membrane protein n=1 Tax=Sphingobacterium luzhongxinii TaxID=2654181 RepID=UPI0013DA0ADF|nr:SusC/RagA family TonB-linked outer membrane protein [Sphingobacterium sp. xlx-73]
MRIATIIACVLIGISAHAQSLLRGRVLDTLNKGLEGVTIHEKGMEKKVFTDRMGNFQIYTAAKEGTLIVRCLGYIDTMKSFDSNSTFLSIVMQNVDVKLEQVDVVNTGYQTLSRERFTGSFEHIDNKALQTRTGYGIFEKIEALAPGLLFDNRSSTPQLNIRGISTLSTGRMDPLVVLDNFPYQGDIDNINPEDIESVTILKDAAATSIWGARAGNGVIVITSKKAKENERPQLSYSSNLNLTPRPDLQYDQRINTSDFIDVELFLFERNHYNATYTGSRKKSIVFSPLIDMLYANKNGDLSDDELNYNIREFRKVDYLEEVSQLFYRPPFAQQHHMSLSTGNSRLQNRFSIGYDQGNGSEIGNAYNRLTAKVVSRFVWGDKFDMDLDLSYSDQSTKGYADLINESYAPGGSRVGMYPYVSFRDGNGEGLSIPKNYNQQYIESLYGGPLLDWRYIPLADIGKSTVSSSSQHVQGGIRFSWKPISGLTLATTYGVEKQSSSGNNIRSVESYYMRDLINRFTQIEGDKVVRKLPLGGRRDDQKGAMFSHHIRGQLGYNRTWGLDHNVSVIVGSELSNTQSANNGNLVYGYDIDRMSSQLVDFENTYPIYDGLGPNSRIPSAGEFSHSLRRFVSFYGNTGYLLKEKYGFSISARKDAANIFGVKTNDRWNPLWSSGISWQMSNENFMKQIRWLDRLNFRITYGHSGNSGGAANYLPTIRYIAPSTSGTTQLPAAAIARLSNPVLRWEDVATTNIGVDFSLLKRSIIGSIDVYRKKSTDILSDDLIDITTGFNTIYRNVASLTGHGAEMRLSGSYQWGGLSGKTTINASVSRTRVKEMYGTIGLGRTYVQNAGRLMQPVVDKELYPVYSYNFAGLNPDNGNPKGIYKGEQSENYTKLINDSLQNMVYHGTALPPYHGSLIQELSFGNWSLSLLFAFKFGHYFQKQTIRYKDLFDSWVGHSDYNSRWQAPGDEAFTNVPSMIYPAVANRDNFYANSSANVFRGDIVRLQDVSLSHNFRIKVSGRTITGRMYGKTNGGTLIWAKNKYGIDPDYLGRPPERRYSLGLQLSI